MNWRCKIGFIENSDSENGKETKISKRHSYTNEIQAEE